MLTLYEELFLLTIHEDRGTFIGWTVDRVKPGLVGAILAELVLQGKVQVGEKYRLQLLDDDPTEDDLLNDVLAMFKESDKQRKIVTWVGSLEQKSDKVRKQLIERLIHKGVVTQEDDHFVWVLPTPLDPEMNASTKYWLNRRLRAVVLAQEDADERAVALLSLLRACNLLDLTFLKDERRLASRQINEFVVSMAMKEPRMQTIQEIESAIAVVVEDD